MKKAIVTTTINPPTEALLKFIKIAHRDDWMVFIVGDQKTPHNDYFKLEVESERVKYLNPDRQEEMSKELSDLIGWNCIQRRNFGLLAAYQWGAEVIATVDDDNIPYENWGRDLLIAGQQDPLSPEGTDLRPELEIFDANGPIFDPLNHMQSPIYHRGYPIQDLPKRGAKMVGRERRRVLVQADLWDGDPDIDAIVRICLSPEVKFNPILPSYTANQPMPFNSQNTFLSREIFPTYFLFPHVGRMDDIWAAYITQRKYPKSVAFSHSTVFQKRNEHDLSKDLEAELMGYKHTKAFTEWCFSKDYEGSAIPEFVPEQTRRAYEVWLGLF